MGRSVQAVLDAHGDDLRPGDAFLLNSPYHGGTHLPDMTVVTPVFDPAGREVQFFTASRAHHADVGGTTPGSMPPGSRDIAEEGALITPTRIVRAGRFDEDLVRRLLLAGPWPARNVAQEPGRPAGRTRGETRAAAANSSGPRWATAGPRCAPYMGTCRTTPRRACAARCRGLRDGSFRYEMDNGQAIVVKVPGGPRRGQRRHRLHRYVATAAQQPHAPRAVTVAAVLYVFRTLVTEPIPLNAAACARSRSSYRRGSLLDPSPRGRWWPATSRPRSASSTRCMARFGVQAAAQGTMNNFTFGNERYQYYETIAGGARRGARLPRRERRADAHDQLQAHRPRGARTSLPVLLREFALPPGFRRRRRNSMAATGWCARWNSASG